MWWRFIAQHLALHPLKEEPPFFNIVNPVSLVIWPQFCYGCWRTRDAYIPNPIFSYEWLFSPYNFKLSRNFTFLGESSLKLNICSRYSTRQKIPRQIINTWVSAEDRSGPRGGWPSKGLLPATTSFPPASALRPHLTAVTGQRPGASRMVAL